MRYAIIYKGWYRKSFVVDLYKSTLINYFITSIGKVFGFQTEHGYYQFHFDRKKKGWKVLN